MFRAKIIFIEKPVVTKNWAYNSWLKLKFDLSFLTP